MREEKGFYRVIALFAAVFCLTVFGIFGSHIEVSAAAKKQTAIQVKVDRKYKASLVKKTDGWYLQSSRISMSTRKAAERVAYLTITKILQSYSKTGPEPDKTQPGQREKDNPEAVWYKGKVCIFQQKNSGCH